MITVQDYKVRGIPADTLARIRRAAAMRGMTQAEYLTALVELHEACREIAESTLGAGRDAIVAILEDLDLQTVRE